MAEKRRLEGVVSKRRDAPYRSGDCRDWRKVKTTAWREANRERWRLFESEEVVLHLDDAVTIDVRNLVRVPTTEQVTTHEVQTSTNK